MDASVASMSGRDERRAGIVEIARKAFLQDGYAGTSMSSIAARLGGSKATLYNYFPSKKHLFVAVADMESKRIISQLFDVEDSGEEPRAALANLCRRFLRVLLSDDMVASQRLIVSEAGRFPEVGHTCYDLGIKRGIQRLAAHFEKAMQQGALRKADPLAAAELFLDLTMGRPQRQRLWSVVERFSAEDIEDYAGRIVSAFLAVYGNDELSRTARQVAG